MPKGRSAHDGQQYCQLAVPLEQLKLTRAAPKNRFLGASRGFQYLALWCHWNGQSNVRLVRHVGRAQVDGFWAVTLRDHIHHHLLEQGDDIRHKQAQTCHWERALLTKVSRELVGFKMNIDCDSRYVTYGYGLSGSHKEAGQVYLNVSLEDMERSRPPWIHCP